MPALDCFARSEAGGDPDGNEDTCVLDDKAGVFVVADGVGGRAAGATASRLAAESFVRRMRSTPAPQRLERSAIAAAVSEANDAVRRAGENDPSLRGLASTLSALVAGDGRGSIVHVGDSRVYRVRDGAASQLTRDHTLGAEVERDGGPAHPGRRFRGMLSRAIGSDERVDADVEDVELGQGDWILLVTDGVSNLLEGDEIGMLVQKGGAAREICNRVFDAAAARKGRDNLTVAVVGVMR